MQFGDPVLNSSIIYGVTAHGEDVKRGSDKDIPHTEQKRVEVEGAPAGPQTEGRISCLRNRFNQVTSTIKNIARRTTVRQRVCMAVCAIVGIAAACIYQCGSPPTGAHTSLETGLVSISSPVCQMVKQTVGAIFYGVIAKESMNNVNQCSFAPQILPPTMKIEYAREMGFLEPADPTFNLNEFLGPVSFPRTNHTAQLAVENAATILEKRKEHLLAIPDTARTFQNTAMAYHDMMVSFDAVERLVRSERVLPDETVGKQELLDQCIQQKEAVFSDLRILNTFITYAEKQVTSKSALTSVEWQYLKSIIFNMKKDVMPEELQNRWDQVKLAMEATDPVSYVYLQGRAVSKELLPDTVTKKLSYLTLNLCFMPETNPMIYGGLLPWRLRIAAIAKKIRGLNPDILFLQEIYDVRAIFELHKRLANCYAHFYGNVTPRLFGLRNETLLPSSGLAIISKFQLTNLNFEPYTSVTAEDQPSAFDRLKLFGFDRNYGVFHGLVMNGRKPLAHVATTHENPFYEDARTNQTRQIVEIFTRLAKNDTMIPLILNGDLNIQKGDLNEGGERLINANFRDHYQGGYTCLEFGDYWHKWNRSVEQFVAANHSYWTLDRSLLWSDWAKGNQYALETERIPMHDIKKPEEALSDHHGILTHFAFA